MKNTKGVYIVFYTMAVLIFLAVLVLILHDPNYSDTDSKYSKSTLLIGHIIYLIIHVLIGVVGFRTYMKDPDLDKYTICLYAVNGMLLILDGVLLVLNTIYYVNNFLDMWWSDTVPILYFFCYVLTIPFLLIIKRIVDTSYSDDLPLYQPF